MLWAKWLGRWIRRICLGESSANSALASSQAEERGGHILQRSRKQTECGMGVSACGRMGRKRRPEGIGKFVCGLQPEIKDGSDEVERTTTRSERRKEARA